MANPALPPSAQVIGNAFVEQYYHILHQSPKLVHKFYHDSSTVSRQNLDGVMTSVKTMKAINDLILSFSSFDDKARINTVDSQNSYNDGVIVLVTGSLTKKDNLTRNFSQSFFLAPQDNGGYFVHNDVFRFVSDDVSVEINPGTANGVAELLSIVIESVPTAHAAPDAEPAYVPARPVVEPAAHPTEEILDNGGQVCDPSDNEEVVVDKVEAAHTQEPLANSTKNEAHQVTKLASSIPQEDEPKKSYAFIVKHMQENRASNVVHVPAKVIKAPALQKAEQLSVNVVSSATKSKTSAPNGNNISESSNNQEEVEGFSIYIRGMPMNISVQRVEEFFKKFGAIKPAGVQVRSNRPHGVCFGFVEFELMGSMQSAVKDSPVRGGGRGPFVPGRGGGLVRNGSFRERGNFNNGGGRGYARNDYGNRGSEFSGRGRGPSGRNGGEGYQRFNQNGNGRVIHNLDGVKQTTVSV
ncbi:hypothetical protein GIB67_009550 [Kingdonia uniflora]|uniref:G3BP-like protein n=1 Tax=Kingdonia uniflora TaxID=39325 RepID=A0A7J7NW80_9MAGN|nr:hypothetical protein GIB67_009550 [Kingdonia uniflora]